MKGITLIGMPASGKSTIGRLLAQELKWPIYDIDKMMEEKEGVKLAKLIKQKGRDYVARLESKTIRGLQLENVILSTPGSIVYNDQVCHDYIKEFTRVIWLKVRLAVVQERLADDLTNKRGVIGLEDGGLKNLFNERNPGYEKLADIKLDTDGQAPETVAKKILKLI